MILLIRATLAVYITWTTVKRVDCFIDLDSDNGYYAEDTDIAEPFASDTMVRTRTFGENSRIRKQPDMSERSGIKPLLRIKPFRTIGDTRPRSDEAERVKAHILIRSRPARINGYISPRQAKQKRPPVVLLVNKHNTHVGQGSEKRHISHKSKKRNRGDDSTRSGHDAASRNVYNPTVHTPSVGPTFYRFNIRSIFPWMARAKRRYHLSQKYGRHNKLYKIFKKYLTTTLQESSFE